MILGEFRENLTVESHLLALELIDEGAVGLVALLADGGIEAYDPELTVIRLLVAAVIESVLAGVHERFLREAFLGPAAMAVSLGARKHVATALG